MTATPAPWYESGMKGIAGDFYGIVDRINETNCAVLVRTYKVLNTASTTTQRMKKIIPDDVEVSLTSRKLPAGPSDEQGVVGVFAYSTPEQLGRLIGLRRYVGRPVDAEGAA